MILLGTMSQPIPTLLKQLRGTAQPCRLVSNEPQPTGTVALDPPEFLTPRAQDLWRATLAAAPADLVKPLDVPVLTQFVIAYDLYLTAAEDVAKHGYQTRGYRGAALVNPSVHVMNTQGMTMRQCIQELGFSPASRTRINSRALDDSGDMAADHWNQIEMKYQ